MDKPPKLYEQVKQYLRNGIAAGTWTEGGRIPSEFELMERLGASRMTVHRALREMSAEGLLLRVQGVGSFVRRQTPRSALLEIHDIAEDIAAGFCPPCTRDEFRIRCVPDSATLQPAVAAGGAL